MKTKIIYVYSMLNILLATLAAPPLLGEDVWPTKEEVAENRIIAEKYSYMTLENWDDLPLLILLPDNIKVWHDGRVVWQDFSKLPDKYFYCTQISEKIILETTNKLIEEYYRSELRGMREISNGTIPLLHGSSKSAFLHSRYLFKVAFWSEAIIDEYRKKRQELNNFSDKETIKLVKEILHFDNKHSLRSSLLSQYCDHNQLGGTQYLNVSEVPESCMRFSADAEFFIKFENIIRGIIPNIDNLESQKINVVKRFVTIKKTPLINGHYEYEYCPCPTGVVPVQGMTDEPKLKVETSKPVPVQGMTDEPKLKVETSKPEKK